MHSRTPPRPHCYLSDLSSPLSNLSLAFGSFWNILEHIQAHSTALADSSFSILESLCVSFASCLGLELLSKNL